MHDETEQGDVFEDMRRSAVKQCELTRGRWSWAALIADYGVPATESETVHIIEAALWSPDVRNSTIAFPTGQIEGVHAGSTRC